MKATFIFGNGHETVSLSAKILQKYIYPEVDSYQCAEINPQYVAVLV